jgi:hypothetical protein
MLILLTCREIFLERENPEGELELYTGIVLWLTKKCEDVNDFNLYNFKGKHKDVKHG